MGEAAVFVRVLFLQRHTLKSHREARPSKMAKPPQCSTMSPIMVRLRSQLNLAKPHKKDLRQLKGGEVLTGKLIRAGVSERGEKLPGEPVNPNTTDSTHLKRTSRKQAPVTPQACRCSV